MKTVDTNDPGLADFIKANEIPDSAMVAEFSQYKALAQLVLEMRKAQRAYSTLHGAKAPSDSALVAARRLEAATDVRLGLLGYR